ncbi:hypothetical protein EDC04DRAFT_2602430 [Pisolithus marmoratus]|nr:hypothetical protein EDC04DRAFT_2602430 [Pisolithus marmoratus]
MSRRKLSVEVKVILAPAGDKYELVEVSCLDELKRRGLTKTPLLGSIEQTPIVPARKLPITLIYAFHSLIAYKYDFDDVADRDQALKSRERGMAEEVKKRGEFEAREGEKEPRRSSESMNRSRFFNGEQKLVHD